MTSHIPRFPVSARILTASIHLYGLAALILSSTSLSPSPAFAEAANKTRAADTSTNVTKLFHFARFDISSLSHNITPVKGPFYCTKIASKLVRTYTDRHGLKDLCRELLQIDISKQQQSSDWGAETLSTEQAEYAAGDVIYLHQIREKLDGMLMREARADIATQCFSFLTTQAKLDLTGFAGMDIFHH